MSLLSFSFFFFFNDTATTEIYTLSLHDALPISIQSLGQLVVGTQLSAPDVGGSQAMQQTYFTVHGEIGLRSEEHTSELQSRSDLVCRLLLEKKKTDASSCRRASPPPRYSYSAPR